MNESDFEKLIDSVIEKRKKESSMATMKLSSIFRKFYDKFEAIRLSYSDEYSVDKDTKFKTYTKEIQNILTVGKKFQNNGGVITEYQIITQMYRVRKSKQKIKVKSDTFIESEKITPSLNLETESKPVQDVPAVIETPSINSLAMSAVNKNNLSMIFESNNIASDSFDCEKETKLLIKEFEQRHLGSAVNQIPLVWRTNDELMLMALKDYSSLQNNVGPGLITWGVLVRKYDPSKIEYFKQWFKKAIEMKKIVK